MPRKTNPLFYYRVAAEIILDGARDAGNAVGGEGLHSLDLMGESKVYRATRKMPHGEPRSPPCQGQGRWIQEIVRGFQRRCRFAAKVRPGVTG
jgi:hypothetical protein